MNKDAVAGYTGSTQRVALTGSSWRTMSHARNVKTSPGKAAGTKCVKVYPQIQIRLREQAFFSPYKKFNIRLDKFSCFIYTYSRHFYARVSVGKESCRKQVNRGKLITSGLFWFARNSVARPVWLDPRSRRSRRDRDLRSVIMAVINHLVKLHRKLA